MEVQSSLVWSETLLAQVPDGYTVSEVHTSPLGKIALVLLDATLQRQVYYEGSCGPVFQAVTAVRFVGEDLFYLGMRRGQIGTREQMVPVWRGVCGEMCDDCSAKNANDPWSEGKFFVIENRPCYWTRYQLDSETDRYRLVWGAQAIWEVDAPIARGQLHVKIGAYRQRPYAHLTFRGYSAFVWAGYASNDAGYADVPRVVTDGQTLAFVARRGDAWFVVKDFVEGWGFEAVGELAHDSGRVCYAAKREGVWRLVTDAAEGEESFIPDPKGDECIPPTRPPIRCLSFIGGEPCYQAVRLFHDPQDPEIPFKRSYVFWKGLRGPFPLIVNERVWSLAGKPVYIVWEPDASSLASNRVNHALYWGHEAIGPSAPSIDYLPEISDTIGKPVFLVRTAEAVPRAGTSGVVQVEEVVRPILSVGSMTVSVRSVEPRAGTFRAVTRLAVGSEVGAAFDAIRSVHVHDGEVCYAARRKGEWFVVRGTWISPPLVNEPRDISWRGGTFVCRVIEETERMRTLREAGDFEAAERAAHEASVDTPSLVVVDGKVVGRHPHVPKILPLENGDYAYVASDLSSRDRSPDVFASNERFLVWAGERSQPCDRVQLHGAWNGMPVCLFIDALAQGEAPVSEAMKKEIRVRVGHNESRVFMGPFFEVEGGDAPHSVLVQDGNALLRVMWKEMVR